MVALRTLSVIVILSAVALAGCTAENSPEGQTATAPGNLAFNGTGSGNHSTKFSCDGTGSANISTNLGSGSMTLTIRDGAGKVAYTETFSGPGQRGFTKSLSGSEGEWTLSVSRTNSFTGQFAISAQC